MDPWSYEAQSYRGSNVVPREDGSSYYSGLLVDLTAKNMFGGRVSGRAQVTLREHSESGCTVYDAELLE